jgi:hypothetical protein
LELTEIIKMGFASAGVAFVARAVAPTPILLRKPLSCDLCMSWWPSVFQAMWAIFEGCGSLSASQGLFGATAASVVILKVTSMVPAGGLLPFLQEAGDTAPAKE